MNPFHFIFGAVLIVAVLLTLTAAKPAWRERLRAAVNTGINGIHEDGLLPRFSNAAITEKYLLAKKGPDANTVVVCTALTDLSQGVITDEAKFAGDPINVAAHAGAGNTRLVRVDVTVAQDDELIPGPTARAVKLAGQAPGTYYPFGRVITPGVQGDVIEYAPCPPIPRVVT